MNELKGYYKEEPDYFDGEYQKKILALIGKSKIVIPESCVGDAVKATLEKNRPKVSQSQSQSPPRPGADHRRRWRIIEHGSTRRLLIAACRGWSR